MNNASNSAIDTSVIDGAVNTFISGSADNLSIISNNNWWTINHGPIYEIARGVTPNINFCAKTIIGINHCAHKYVIRDMVDKYHNEFPTAHMKQIMAIEPRGINGCYYKFTKVDFDATDNTEGVIEQEDELILTHEIGDYATCTFKPALITTNISDPSYPIRSYIDAATATSESPRVIYPTRDTVYTSDLVARFVRVRGVNLQLLALTQIAVFDVSGINISINKSTYATSMASTSASAFREGTETPEVELNSTSSAADVVIANVFPNPTNGKLNVILEASDAQNAQLRICDITGRNVLQNNATCTSGSNTIILDMESLPNGYYLLVIDNGNASSTMRVVKN
jgi:hypothetical protein